MCPETTGASPENPPHDNDSIDDDANRLLVGTSILAHDIAGLQLIILSLQIAETPSDIDSAIGIVRTPVTSLMLQIESHHATMRNKDVLEAQADDSSPTTNYRQIRYDRVYSTINKRMGGCIIP